LFKFPEAFSQSGIGSGDDSSSGFWGATARRGVLPLMMWSLILGGGIFV
jgi:hypothetical protein